MINGLRRLRRIIADRVGKKIGRKARRNDEPLGKENSGNFLSDFLGSYILKEMIFKNFFTSKKNSENLIPLSFPNLRYMNLNNASFLLHMLDS